MSPGFKKGALVWYQQRDGAYTEAKVTIVLNFTFDVLPEAKSALLFTFKLLFRIS